MLWIESTVHFIEQSWFNALLGIAAFAYGIFAYIRGRKRTRLAYVHLGEHLLGSASDALPPAIVVQYDGISIPRLTKSLLIIWNSGENTVSGTDIVDKDPLRLQIGDDGKILSVTVLKASRAVNDVKVSPASDLAPNEVALSFDYLDTKDGVVVEILHTSSDRKPRVKGTLRGLPQGFDNLGQFTRPKPPVSQRNSVFSKIRAVIFSPPFIAVAGFFFAIYGPRPEFLSDPHSVNTFVPGALGGFCGMWAVSSYTSRRKYPKPLHIEALE